MTRLQSGMSRPSSATEVANRQLIVPFRNFIMVRTCSRYETFISPASPLRVPIYSGQVSVKMTNYNVNIITYQYTNTNVRCSDV
jgi:hypothetical protein